ncbi:MAG TPA: DUF6345 domain-containing protein [Parvularculaceae bacterium]|nr:DUF6345 domain-containing protein [Parvularculaceae bacterium]
MIRSIRMTVACAIAGLISSTAGAQDYSTGAVDIYNTCGVGPDLPLTIPEAANVRSWYNLAHFPNVSRWENADVWNTDFTDGPGKDMEPQGGSDLPNIYFFSGHGICQNPPAATSPDFISTCSGGVNGNTNIGNSSRWGNSGGRLQFAFIDASCPMDLVSLGNNWFPPFQGLHVAVGHSGRTTNDTLDSSSRGGEFAARTVGARATFLGITIWTIPRLPVTWAWMNSGLIDVQNQVCAVSIANDTTAATASNRRDNEFVSPAWARPSGNWYAWRWVCR